MSTPNRRGSGQASTCTGAGWGEEGSPSGSFRNHSFMTLRETSDWSLRLWGEHP